MKFKETMFAGCYLIQLEPIKDDRGFFARSWCAREFAKHGLQDVFVQCNISYNERKGTLRGLHLQKTPYGESKLIRCSRGAIYDVVLDLRKSSSTYRKWQSFHLSEENGDMLYIPEGFAHGFQTLQANTEVLYQMGQFYNPDYSSGVRWNDPSFNFVWPIEEDKVISSKDMNYEDYDT